MALLLTLILTANDFAGLDPGPQKAALVRQHASWGLVFLLCMSLRVYWRCSNPNPVYSYTLHPLQEFAAVFLHRLIYFVVIAQSLVGLFTLLNAGSGIPLFAYYETAALLHRREGAYELGKSLHYALYMAVFPLFALHISAAIYHQLFGVKDD